MRATRNALKRRTSISAMTNPARLLPLRTRGDSSSEEVSVEFSWAAGFFRFLRGVGVDQRNATYLRRRQGGRASVGKTRPAHLRIDSCSSMSCKGSTLSFGGEGKAEKTRQNVPREASAQPPRTNRSPSSAPPPRSSRGQFPVPEFRVSREKRSCCENRGPGRRRPSFRAQAVEGRTLATRH